MDVCKNCEQNLCDLCEDSDCACSRSSHTLAAGVVVHDAVEALNPEWAVVYADTVESHEERSNFQVRINGRAYQVTVQPA